MAILRDNNNLTFDQLFDFVEETNSESGAFIFKNIKRNQADVYYARIK